MVTPEVPLDHAGGGKGSGIITKIVAMQVPE
jgi:hypothetical protein